MSESRLAVAERMLTDAYLKLEARIASGEASAADFKMAMEYAKAAGVEVIKVGLPGSPAAGLGKALTDNLPFAGDPVGGLQ